MLKRQKTAEAETHQAESQSDRENWHLEDTHYCLFSNLYSETNLQKIRDSPSLR